MVMAIGWTSVRRRAWEPEAVVLAEFILIAFVVGIATASWHGFVGALAGLLVVYRLPALGGLLSLMLSLYWSLLGYWLGASAGTMGGGLLLAAAAFIGSARLHRRGFASAAGFLSRIRRQRLGPPEITRRGRNGAPPTADVDEFQVLDAEYRVVS